MKREILQELRAHHPQLVNTEYFPYIWELITPEDCVQKKAMHIETYNLSSSLESFLKRIKSLMDTSTPFKLDTLKGNYIKITMLVLEELPKTVERVAKKLVDYSNEYGRNLENNPILLALGLTSSELIKVLEAKWTSKMFSDITKHTETLEEFRERLLKSINQM